VGFKSWGASPLRPAGGCAPVDRAGPIPQCLLLCCIVTHALG